MRMLPLVLVLAGCMPSFALHTGTDVAGRMDAGQAVTGVGSGGAAAIDATLPDGSRVKVDAGGGSAEMKALNEVAASINAKAEAMLQKGEALLGKLAWIMTLLLVAAGGIAYLALTETGKAIIRTYLFKKGTP